MAGFPWFFPHERFLQFETPGWSGSTQNRLGLTYPTEVRGGGVFLLGKLEEAENVGIFFSSSVNNGATTATTTTNNNNNSSSNNNNSNNNNNNNNKNPTTTTTTTRTTAAAATTTTTATTRRRRRYYNKHLVVWTADFTKDNHNNNSSVFEWCIFLVAQMTLTLSGQVINLWESPPKTSAVLRSFSISASDPGLRQVGTGFPWLSGDACLTFGDIWISG